jgi:hypothetical protein
VTRVDPQHERKKKIKMAKLASACNHRTQKDKEGHCQIQVQHDGYTVKTQSQKEKQEKEQKGKEHILSSLSEKRGF